MYLFPLWFEFRLAMTYKIKKTDTEREGWELGARQLLKLDKQL